VTQALPVRHALHSAAIDGIEHHFLAHANTVEFAPLRVPIYSPTHGGWLERVDANSLWRALRAQIDFRSAIETLDEQSALFVDLGPSGTLAGFVRHHFDHAAAERSSGRLAERSVVALNRFGRSLESLARLLGQLERPEQRESA
jgi:acyl transferase domain-containing protein